MRRLSYKVILAVSALVLMGCVSAFTVPEWNPVYTPPPPEQAKNTLEIMAPYDDVWKAVVRVYADRNITIETIEKVSGIVASQDIIFPMDVFLQYMNPGKYSAKEPYSIRPTSQRLSTNIFVEKMGDNRTLVRINLKGTVEWETAYQNYPYHKTADLGVTDCQSTGKLEAALFKEILAKVVG
jgi:hypothetical protein